MTAAHEQEVRTPPRVVVRTFWVLQRGLLRVREGRAAVSLPEAGKKLGMLPVTTVGRLHPSRLGAVDD